MLFFFKLTTDFLSIEKILRQCASWRETITREKEDLGFINRLSKQLNTRKELWKFYQVTTEHIRDWKNTPIKKLDSKKIEDKLNLWDQESKNLKTNLADDDRVWLSWNNQIQSFKLIMRWISKLIDGTFNDDDFDELFSAVGKLYDKENDYTIQNFIDMKLDDHIDLINAIYKRANTNLTSIKLFEKIKETWQRKIKYKLAKNYPITSLHGKLQ